MYTCMQIFMIRTWCKNDKIIKVEHAYMVQSFGAQTIRSFKTTELCTLVKLKPKTNLCSKLNICNTCSCKNQYLSSVTCCIYK